MSTDYQSFWECASTHFQSQGERVLKSAFKNNDAFKCLEQCFNTDMKLKLSPRLFLSTPKSVMHWALPYGLQMQSAGSTCLNTNHVSVSVMFFGHLSVCARVNCSVSHSKRTGAEVVCRPPE